MTAFLPPNLLALFAPRDPIPYLPPTDKLSHEKKRQPYTGVGGFFSYFEDPKDTPPPTRVETREERLERKRREKAEQVAYKLEQDIALWDPHNIPDGTSDAFKTLFVARINYDTSESKLRREFESYGPIKKIVMVPDKKTGKPRGYAFIEYEHERDMHSAYKHADGKKIDGRRVLVDVERARTVKGWLPRRLGGGLGGTRKGGPEVNVKHSGRDDASRHDSRENERERDNKDREREREKERDRDRERERERRRSRSRERERRRRSISRGKDRRRERRKRSREKSRERDRDRDKENEEREVPEELEDRKDRIEKKRSKSRERKRSRRSRSKDRDREKRRRDHEERDRERERIREPRDEIIIPEGIVIKQESPSEYNEDSRGDFSNSNQGNYNYPTYEDDEAQQAFGAKFANPL